MRPGKTSGAYKDDRPVSFMPVPPAGHKWQVVDKVPAVWCKRFDGSMRTIEDFLEHLFRDRTQRVRAIADFFSGSGRAVGMWNSIRYPESSCRLCKAMSSSQNEIGEEAGHGLFRLLFAQTGWMLLEPGMTKATEGTPSSVQRSADGISHQWVSGIARILATMLGEDLGGTGEGDPPKTLTRGQVTTTKGVYACLGGPCGHGCGTPNVGDVRCIQCTILHMTLGSAQVGSSRRVREAVRHMHAVPWFTKPKVCKPPEVCVFR